MLVRRRGNYGLARALFVDLESIVYLCRQLVHSTYVECWRGVDVLSSRREHCRCWRRCASSQPQWRHGYALANHTGLKSGTLYPILIRLADRGLVEACWQDEPVPGRPRRHLYRLTADGLASATGALAAAVPQQQAARSSSGVTQPIAARAGPRAR